MRRGILPNRVVVSAAALAACACAARADIPQMGGPMSHLLVSVFDQRVFVGFESPSMATVELQGRGSAFDGPASVLSGSAHNAQFGWLANGFIALPPGSGVFVERVSSSMHLTVYEESTFDPILGTAGSPDAWQWDGSMTHNWYASDVHGTHAAAYKVFVGNAQGDPLEGWTGALVELTFVLGSGASGTLISGAGAGNADGLGGRVVTGGGPIGAAPAPGALAALSLGALGLGARRRR